MVTGLQERPRELRWYHAAGLLFGDWGTSRLYVLGLAYVMAGPSAFWLVAAMCVFMTVVGACYGIVCGHFPDGAGVYTVGRAVSPTLGVVGALFLLADCVLTASLSAYVAFRYILPPEFGAEAAMYLGAAAIAVLGMINYFGLKRAGAFAVTVGGLAVAAYVLLAGLCAAKAGRVDLPLPARDAAQPLLQLAGMQWSRFVSMILALSGIESIASMTGVMSKPVGRNARLAMFTVLAEVVALNLVMAYAMNAVPALADGASEMTQRFREDARDHMVRILAETYAGPVFAQVSSVIFGVLLISAANTAIANIVTLQYLMARDGELPAKLTWLNRHGMPLIPLLSAVGIPAVLLLVVGADLERLADLYAVGVVGAIAVNVLSAGANRRLPLLNWQRWVLLLTGAGMVAVEATICVEKPHAAAFAGAFVALGLMARAVARTMRKPMPAPASIPAPVAVAQEPLPAGAPRFLVATRGATDLMKFAVKQAAERGAVLYALYVREVMLAFRERGRPIAHGGLTMETDADARAVFEKAGKFCREAGVRFVPLYMVSDSPAEAIVDAAATFGVDALIMGTTRQGRLIRTLHGDIVRETLEFLPKNIQLVIYKGDD